MATFEDWEPGGRTFDAVTAGQAWHWIDPVAGAAKAARVLRPGGLLIAFWNAFQLPPEVAQAFATALPAVVPDAPFDPTALTRPTLTAYGAVLAATADGIDRAGDFEKPERWRFDWEAVHSRDALLDQLPTIGLLTRLPEPQLARILRDVGAAVDALGGSFTMLYATVAVAATRTARG